MKDKLPPFIEICRALIVTPSISTTEEALDQSNVDLTTLPTDWFKDLGFNVEVQPVPGTHNKSNVLVSHGQGADGLLLTGRTNMASFDDGRQTHDPFTLTEHDGKFYDLGTANVKGFFAFVLDVLRDTDVARPAKPFCILATADEETSMAGMRYFAETTAPRPDYTIIGEPVSLQPIHAHKDHTSSTVHVQGQSSHSSDPTRGVNAIELMHSAIGHILQLRDSLKEHYHHDVFTVSYPTLSLRHIHDGDASSRIYTYYELYMNTRPLPDMTLDELNGLLNDTLVPMSRCWPGCLTVDGLHPPIPGYECPPNHQLVEMVERLLGAGTEVVNYCIRVSFI